MKHKNLWYDAPSGLGLARLPYRIWQSGGVSRLFPLGEILGKDGFKSQRRALSQAVFFAGDKLVCREAPKWSPTQDAVLSSLGEIIQRSELGPVAPSVERTLLAGAGCESWYASSGSGSLRVLGLSREEGVACVLNAPLGLARATSFVDPIRQYEDEVAGQQSAEKAFLQIVWKRWPRLFPWVHSQVLLSSLGFSNKDSRRIDFLISFPASSNTPIGEQTIRGVAVEIHGKDKSGAHSNFDNQVEKRAQEKKRNDLSKAGFQVVDIPRADALAGQGDWIELFEKLAIELGEYEIPPDLSFLLDGAWISSAIDLSLWTMLGEGTWSSNTKELVFQVPTAFEAVARRSIAAFCVLTRSVERLWSLTEADRLLKDEMSVRVQSYGASEPSSITVRINPSYRSYWPSGEALPDNVGEIWRADFPFDASPELHPCGELWSPQKHSALIGQRPKLSDDAEDLNRILKPVLGRAFGKSGFREGQLKGIQAALSGVDCLVLLPAGHGKSLIFQLASLLLPGTTIVVEPLRSLLDDQRRVLHESGISRVLTIHKDSPFKGSLADYGLIYISPERLYIANFESELRELVKESGLDLLVIDEAHSVSECGHSYRPAYLGFKERLLGFVKGCSEPRKPPSVLGLTATAVDTVVRDVCALLGIGSDPVSLASSFAKKNLTVKCFGRNLGAPNKEENSGLDGSQKLPQGTPPSMERMLATALLEQQDQSIKTLVFCSSTRKWTGGRAKQARWYGVEGTAEKVGELLGSESPRVATYTGGMMANEKEASYQSFLSGEATMMVATPAFGTGVDISDIRRVIHVGAPSGLEAWYQESGRAGRDGQLASAYVLLDLEDDDFFIELGKLENQADSFGELRKLMGKLEFKGSFFRQMQLLLGDAPPSPQEVNMDLEIKCFLGSFPGWEFETTVYDDVVINRVVDALERGKGDRPITISCHRSHETHLWKAICRLTLAAIIQKQYRRTFFMHRPNSFEIEVGDNVYAENPQGLAKCVREQGVRLLSGGMRARLLAKLEQEQEDCVGVFDSCLRTRLKAAVRKIAFVSYESVREIRMGSLLAMRQFFYLKNDADRRAYIDMYVKSDPDQARFLHAVREDEGQLLEWQGWLDMLSERYDWPGLSGLLSQAASAGLGSTLPDFIFLAVGFSKQEIKVDGPSSLRVARLVHGGMLPPETFSWCMNELFARGEHDFLDLLNMVVEPEAGEGLPKPIQDWILQLPNAVGNHAIVKKGMTHFINEILS